MRYLPLAKRRVETETSPFWISYADLMTALVMLFLVVMSISMVAVASRAMVEKKSRETEIQKLLEELDQEVRKRGMDVQVNRLSDTISMGEKALFAHDSYRLTRSAKEALQALVPVLLESSATDKGKRWLKRIHIEGYTDETGSYLYNVNLSLHRAQAVVCALFAGDLTEEQQSQLKKLLIIDGATITSVKPTRDESRRVEVRLEFRQLGDTEVAPPAVEMPLGKCAIRMDDAPEEGEKH